MAKQKPVILSDYKSDTDDFGFDPSIFGETNDPYYIPGYTEQCKANDVEKADDFRFREQHQSDGITKQKLYDEVIKCQPRALPYVFSWLRVIGIDGTANANVVRDMYEYTKRGYKKVNWHEDQERIFSANGWGMPPGAVIEADGTVRRDDLALFVVDGRAERAWEKWLAEYTASLESSKSENEDGVSNKGSTNKTSEIVTVQ